MNKLAKAVEKTKAKINTAVDKMVLILITKTIIAYGSEKRNLFRKVLLK